MPNSYSLSRATPPATPLVGVAEAKDHMRIPATDTCQDPVIMGMIATAERKVEEDADISAQAQVWYYRTPRFRNFQQIPRPPLDSIVLKYHDQAGDVQTVDAAVYDVHPECLPGIVTLAANQEWPDDVQAAFLPILYEVTAAASGDPRIVQAILLLVTHWYEQRKAAEPVNLLDIPHGYEALISNLKPGTVAGTY